VLFLDELPEFKRNVLEALREPLESGSITISRKGHQLEIPAKFQLIAAMNPCPCGYYKSQINECTCSPDQIKRYHAKISGPLLDRIDLSIFVPMQSNNGFLTKEIAESSHSIQQRVTAARIIQSQRQSKTNAQLTNKEVVQHCQLMESDQKTLEEFTVKLKISMRSQQKILKIARTLADLAGEKNITSEYLKEAVAYRNKL
jgi:magnesium chelatase family protein